MRVELNLPLNRVEGDLELEVVVEDGIVVEARSVGTMYRGFENILKNRAPLDALVITPRVCGICSVSHLMASVKALESAYGVVPPLQARRLRALSLMSETVQSDIRQVVFMYMSDFSDEVYKERSFYKRASELYKPVVGKAMKEALRASSTILKVVATIGGQWPHTSHMVPGGISTIPSIVDLTFIKEYIDEVYGWYGEWFLGMEIEEFLEQKRFFFPVKESLLKDFVDFAFEVELHKKGRSYQNFLSYGAFELEDRLFRGGVFIQGRYFPLDEKKIYEDTTYAKYKTQILHPSQESTELELQKGYTLAKAPRYDGKVMQTGPLALLLVNGYDVILDLYAQFQDSAFSREYARIYRGALYLSMMRKLVDEAIREYGAPTYEEPKEVRFAQGVGLTEAARGALGHWVRIEAGQIERYQIISPTTWNGSPMDASGNLGPWEKALVGLEIEDISSPVEIGHVIRSFDPCLVCTVHAIDRHKRSYRWQMGL